MQCDVTVDTQSNEMNKLDKEFFEYLYAQSDVSNEMPMQIKKKYKSGWR